MNEEKQKHIMDYFTDMIAQLQTQAQALTADDRADESVFAKIRMNVYDIFRTVFSAGLKITGQDGEKAVQFLLTKLRQIPESWRTALTAAEAHGDSGKAHTERIKLEAAEEILVQIQKIREETT